jgi:adenosylcobyric acid synthase
MPIERDNGPMSAARAIFIGGTGSHVGKSWMATAICRYLCNRGLRVAPFKAQNMSNNSYPCAAGAEIGRAQAAQAEACGLAPHPDMNPILLKPTGESGCQVVLNGKVWRDVAACDYYEHRDLLWRMALEAYTRLAKRFDYVVIEGAGSVAELNLKARDIVNLRFARAVGARGMLVGDIDRGGIFASIIGTYSLVDEEERSVLASFAVNRFRGNRSLFDDGVRILEQRTGARCMGVFPMAGIDLAAEDSLSLEEMGDEENARIALLRFPRISNLTDFRLLRATWVARPASRAFDWILLPGSKNTIADLEWMREQRLDEWVVAQHRRGARLLGICGGYQMLGESIDDPHGVEGGPARSVEGLGLLPVRTRMEHTKLARVVRGNAMGTEFSAYEIHMGRTTALQPVEPFARLDDGTSDGAIVGQAAGTYLHGALEDRTLAGLLFGEHNLRPNLAAPYDELAQWFTHHADVSLFEQLYL